MSRIMSRASRSVLDQREKTQRKEMHHKLQCNGEHKHKSYGQGWDPWHDFTALHWVFTPLPSISTCKCASVCRWWSVNSLVDYYNLSICLFQTQWNRMNQSECVRWLDGDIWEWFPVFGDGVEAAVGWFTCPWWVHEVWSPCPNRFRNVWGHRKDSGHGLSRHQESGIRKKGEAISQSWHWQTQGSHLFIPVPHMSVDKCDLASNADETPSRNLVPPAVYQSSGLQCAEHNHTLSKLSEQQTNPSDKPAASPTCRYEAMMPALVRVVQSRWNTWGDMLRSWRVRGGVYLPQVAGSALLSAAAAADRARAAHAMLLCRGFKPFTSESSLTSR